MEDDIISFIYGEDDDIISSIYGKNKIIDCFIVGGGWLIYNRVWEEGQGVGIIL